MTINIGKIRNAGRIEIADTLLWEAPEAIETIMGEMIVLRAEHLFHKGTFEYMAVSKHFRPVDAGEMIPQYLITVTENENTLWDIRFEECPNPYYGGHVSVVRKPIERGETVER